MVSEIEYPLFAQRDSSSDCRQLEASKARNTSQKELSMQSGVPLATIRLFEQKGKISLSNLVKIVIALGEEEALVRLLEPGEFQTLFGHKSRPGKRIRATGSRKVRNV